MERRGKILWLDNDKYRLEPFIRALERRNWPVTFVTSVTAASSALQNDEFDLLILDVMIPTKNAKEERVYPPNETGRGHRTGLVFYKKNLPLLKSRSIPTMVFTVRIDKEIRKVFAGLAEPPAGFFTKMDLRDPESFVSKVKSLTGVR